MVRPEATRERIGDMLVASGLVSRAQLSDALAAQKTSRLPLGKQLVALGHVREAQLIQVLSNQLSVPWVSIERVEFSADLLARLPAELADRYTVMPIYVRAVKGRGDTLYVAMDDPTDEEAITAVTSATGLKVRVMIASPTELRAVIEERYFGAAPPSPPALNAGFGEERTGRTRSIKDVSRVREIEETRGPKVRPPPPPKAPARVPEGAVPTEQYAKPSKPPMDSGRTLTLLDGTRIQLPGGRKGGSAQPVTEVRHVVKAVSNAANDLGGGESLRWHDIVQALIDAATTRGVTLTRREVAEAWLRGRDQPERRTGEG